MSSAWSSALAGALERDRQRQLLAFIEWRARRLQTTSEQFAGGETERADVLVQTEHDYIALIEFGAEAGRDRAPVAAPRSLSRLRPAEQSS